MSLVNGGRGKRGGLNNSGFGSGSGGVRDRRFERGRKETLEPLVRIDKLGGDLPLLDRSLPELIGS